MNPNPTPPRKERRLVPTVSAVLPDGSLVEVVYDRPARRTRLVVGRGNDWQFQQQIEDRGLTRVAYSASNQLLAQGVVQFPSRPEEYGDEASLVDEIARYIHRYVDVSPRFERFASYYVLFSWAYDAFNEPTIRTPHASPDDAGTYPVGRA